MDDSGKESKAPPIERTITDHFLHALSIAVIKYTGSLKFSYLKKAYPEIYIYDKDGLEESFSQVQKSLKAWMETDARRLFTKSGIGPVLITLEKTLESSQKEKEIFQKLQEKKKLEAILRELHLSNEQYEEAVYVTHDEMLLLKKQITDASENVLEKLDILSKNIHRHSS